jgi:hypothetical protein
LCTYHQGGRCKKTPLARAMHLAVKAFVVVAFEEVASVIFEEADS